jgi:hypothetical protein
MVHRSDIFYLHVLRHLRCFLVLILAAFISIISVAIGDCQYELGVTSPNAHVVFNGVELAVSERVEIGGDLVKLSLGDKSALVSKTSEGRKVAEWYLSSAAASQNLELMQLKGIISTAIALRDEALIDLALARAIDVGGLCRNCESELSRAQFWRCLSPLKSLDDDEFLLKALMRIDPLKLHEGVVVDRFCQAGAVLTANLLAAKRRSLDQVLPDIGFIERCSRSLMVSYLQDLFSGVNGSLSIAELEQIWELAELKRDNAPISSIYSGLSAIKDLNHSINSGNSILFSEALSRVQDLASSLQIKLNDVAIREHFIGQAIHNVRFGDALLQFKRIDIKLRSPRTHALLLKIIQGLTTNERELLSDADLQAIVKVYAQKDSEVQGALLGAYLRIGPSQSDHGFTDSDLILAREFKGLGANLTEIDFDFFEPVVRQRLEMGDIAGALGIVDEFDLNLSFRTRLRLSLARLAPFSLLGVPPALIAVTTILIGVVARHFLGARRRSAYGSKIGQQVSARDKQEGVLFSDEYISALASFSLTPAATKEDIKNAYRAAVKRCHPDLAGVSEGSQGNGDVATTRFIELKERYERLLKLYEAQAERE